MPVPLPMVSAMLLVVSGMQEKPLVLKVTSVYTGLSPSEQLLVMRASYDEAGFNPTRAM